MLEKNKRLEIKRYYRCTELCKYLGIGASTLYRLVREKKFAGKVICKNTVVYDILEVEEALFGADNA